FSLHSQRKAMSNSVQTTAQLHSSHTLVKQELDPCKAELIILGRTIKKQVNLSATYLESPCQNLGLSLLVEFQIFMQCI
ncbi:unnamed protein product, partial [Rangifer tarandus platyrhynchus]